MMRARIDEFDQRPPSPPSLLIAAHCSTIQRKGKRIEVTELSGIFDDVTRELSTENLRPISYLQSLNEIIKVLNSSRLTILPKLSSHYFFLLVRNTIRDLLRNFVQYKRLTDEEIYVLRNSVILIHHLIDEIFDVSQVLFWITDATFLDALGECLDRIRKLCKKDRNRPVIKQITRLLNMFAIVQERLPLELHRSLFVRLLQPTINCLTSLKYMEYFRNLQSDSKSLTENQKLYLLKCPYFLTTYSGPHIEKTMKYMLDIMLPRYVDILDEHIPTIQQWKRPIMRAIHNLIITIVFAEGYFAPYVHTDSFRMLVNHLLTILNQSTLVERIHPYSNNMETLLIDAALIVFNVLVYESNALDYIKQCKPSKIFRKLTEASYETISLNAYMMLAYTIEQEDIRTSPDDLPRLLMTTVNLLRKTMVSLEEMNHNRSVLQLLETLKGLSQHEQICDEIFKQDLVTFFIDYQAKLHGLPKQILLECLWQLSFNDKIAQQLREHTQFISSLENLPKTTEDFVPSNTLRRSSSFGSRRNSLSTVTADVANYGIQKVADGILWKVIKERECREKMEKRLKTISNNDQEKYKHDIVISLSFSDRNMVQRIQQYLINEGFHVWSERNHNYEHPMKIVADAIENSEFVLICLSDSYKRDNRCQAQAEYASVCKRLILPIIVHSGYKPDGWLIPLVGNRTPIDFEISNFEKASQLLLEEIKRRQSKKNVSYSRNTMPASPGTIRKPSVSRTNSDEPFSSKEYSGSSEITMSSSSFNSSHSPATVADGENLMSTRSKSRSSTPGVNNKLSESSIYSIIRPSTPVSNHAAASMTALREHQQQPPMSNSIPVHPSAVDNYQQRLPTQAVFILSRPVSSASGVANTEYKQQQQQQQQQQNLSRPLARSPTPSSVSLDPSGTARVERQQQLLYPVHAEGVLSVDNISIASTVADQQQPRTPTQPILGILLPASNTSTTSTVTDRQQSQELMRSDTQSIASTSLSSASNTEAGLREQPTTIGSMSKSELSSVSAGVDYKQEELLQQTANVSTRASHTNTVLSSTHQQPSNVVTRSLTNGVSSFPTSTVIDEESQQQTRSYPISTSFKPDSTFSHERNIISQQPHEKIFVNSTPQMTELNSVSSAAPTRPESQASIKSKSREVVSPALPPIAPGSSNKQRRHTSTHSTPKSSALVSSDIDNQSLLPPVSRSTSNSVLPAPAANTSSTSLSQYPLSQANAREQWSLLDKYINRKTDNSIYRTLSLDTWRNNDVLDFLCDARLHLIMPLCESMSGKALMRLVRMCQKKPTRLYDQLNEELRTRFKGLTLPMGTYTQFLTEMDALVGSKTHASSSAHDREPKVVERVIVMPRTFQQAQVNSAPSALSSVSSDHSNAAALIDNPSETTKSRNTRIVERAIYRPASNMEQPYNFIIESTQEPTALLDQVYRYGNRFFVLDTTTHQQHEISK